MLARPPVRTHGFPYPTMCTMLYYSLLGCSAFPYTYAICAPLLATRFYATTRYGVQQVERDMRRRRVLDKEQDEKDQQRLTDQQKDRRIGDAGYRCATHSHKPLQQAHPFFKTECVWFIEGLTALQMSAQLQTGDLCILSFICHHSVYM